jgi:hypothetical protein
MPRDFFDPTPEQQIVVLIGASTATKNMQKFPLIGFWIASLVQGRA